MATEQQNFRTAFNGFNREDVVAYIEEINTKHAAQISQLNTDLQYLQEKLTQYEDLAEDGVEDANPALEQQIEDQAQALMEQTDRIAALEKQLAEAQDAAQTAEALLEEATAENIRLQMQLKTAQACNASFQSQQVAELDAYRRAERVERQANERALQIHHQVNGILGDATCKVDEAAAQIAAMTEEAMQQLKQLQLAVTGSKLVLQEAAAAISAVRPTEE